MIIYEFTHDGDVFAYPSLRKAKSERAKLFDRPQRPEIMQVDIGKLTKSKACALLMRSGYAESIKDVA